MTTRRYLHLLASAVIAIPTIGVLVPAIPAAASDSNDVYVDVVSDGAGGSFRLVRRSAPTEVTIVEHIGADGDPVADFGGDGSVELPQVPIARAMALDGTILYVAGDADATGGDDAALVAALDTTTGGLSDSFGTGGIAEVGETGRDVTVRDVTVADGLVGVTGSSFIAGSPATDPRVLVAQLTSGGSLDASFSEDGLMSTGEPGTGVRILATAAGYVIGQGPALGESQADASVARVGGDGELDTSFGGGSVDLGIDGPLATIEGLGLTTDSRIAIGLATTNGPTIAVLTTAGVLDTGFRSDGTVTFDTGSATSTDEVTFAVRPDGRMLFTATGYVEATDEVHLYVVGLTSSGSLDATVGRSGWRTEAPEWLNVEAGITAMALDTSGQVHIVGFRDRDLGVFTPEALVTTAGAQAAPTWPSPVENTAFATDGTLRLATGSTVRPVADLFVRESGKLVVLTTQYGPNGETTVSVEKRRPNGRPDATFGENGTAVFPSRRGLESVGAVAPQADRILVAVSERGGERAQLSLVRLTGDGALDPTFGSGSRTSARADSSLTPVDIAIDDRGRIVVLSIGTAGSDRSAVVSRFGPDGRPDTRFGDRGSASFALSASRTPSALTPHGPGYVVAVNSTVPTDRAVLVRLNGNGSLDSDFDRDGFRVGLPASARQVLVEDVTAVGGSAREPGRLAVAYSHARSGSPVPRGRLALTSAAGALRPSFGDGGSRPIPGGRTVVTEGRRGRLAVTTVGDALTRVTYLPDGTRDRSVPVVSATVPSVGRELVRIAVHPTDPAAPVYGGRSAVVVRLPVR